MNESPGASFPGYVISLSHKCFLAETSYHLKDSVYLYRIDNPNSSVYDTKRRWLLQMNMIF